MSRTTFSENTLEAFSLDRAHSLSCHLLSITQKQVSAHLTDVLRITVNIFSSY